MSIRTFVITYYWECLQQALFCVQCLLTLTAISVERLLALTLGLRYKHVVTLKRTYIIIVTFWLVSAAFQSLSLWNPLISFWCMVVDYAVCLTTSIISYTTVSIYLRRHQNQVKTQARKSIEPNKSTEHSTI